MPSRRRTRRRAIDAAAAERLDRPTAPVEAPAPAAETDQVAAAAAAQTAALLHRFRPGQNLDAEIEAYEREQAALEAGAAVAETPVDEPTSSSRSVAAALVVERDRRTGRRADVEPARRSRSPQTSRAEPSPSRPPRADATPTSRPSTPQAAAAALAAVAAQRTDVVEQPTWQIVAPDVDAPAGRGPPMTPVPAGPERHASSGRANGARVAGPRPGDEPACRSSGARPSRPAASSRCGPSRAARSRPRRRRRVDAAQGGVQPCVSCGLSLSATARFCRRCGTSQVA